MKMILKLTYIPILFAFFLALMSISACGIVADKASQNDDCNNEVIIAKSQEGKQAIETHMESYPEVSPETDEQMDQDISGDVGKGFRETDKTMDNIGDLFLYIDKNIQYAEPELATEMVYEVIRLSQDYEYDFNDKFLDSKVQEKINDISGSLGQIDIESLLDADDQELKDLAEEAVEKRYRLITVEGFVTAIVDYKSYYIYSPYLTEEMNAYIDIMAQESEGPSILDAGIVILMGVFVERISDSMKYVADHPDSPRTDQIKEYSDTMLFFYLGGIDNSPVYDPKGEIIPDRLEEFENTYEEYEGSKLGDILYKYLTLLEQEDYNRTQEVDDFLLGILGI